MTAAFRGDRGPEDRLPAPPVRPRLITSDAEAIAAAEELAPRLAADAAERDRARRLP